MKIFVATIINDPGSMEENKIHAQKVSQESKDHAMLLALNEAHEFVLKETGENWDLMLENLDSYGMQVIVKEFEVGMNNITIKIEKSCGNSYVQISGDESVAPEFYLMQHGETILDVLQRKRRFVYRAIEKANMEYNKLAELVEIHLSSLQK